MFLWIPSLCLHRALNPDEYHADHLIRVNVRVNDDHLHHRQANEHAEKKTGHIASSV
jgi:hypothetical protein